MLTPELKFLEIHNAYCTDYIRNQYLEFIPVLHSGERSVLILFYQLLYLQVLWRHGGHEGDAGKFNTHSKPMILSTGMNLSTNVMK